MSFPVSIESALHAAHEHLREAEGFLAAFSSEYGLPDDWAEDRIGRHVETAFVQVLVLLESLGLSGMLGQVKQDYDRAKKEGFSSTFDYEGEFYLSWANDIRKYLSCIEANYGLGTLLKVETSLDAILRRTEYSITDDRCWKTSPQSEIDVHLRVETVLRCVFPDLKHKPTLSKPIKSFEPDTGLPSQHALVEYKFVGTKKDAATVADEILADTRGYTSKDWTRFYFLIYETRRFYSEEHWNGLLHECGAAHNATALVIRGEPVPSSRRRVVRKEGVSSSRKRRGR